MPFDGNPAKFAKPDVFSLEGLVAWLETRPADERYCYGDTGHCLWHQYMTAQGVPVHIVGGWIWFDKSSRRHYLPGCSDDNRAGWGARIASDFPHTFGAALSRARKLLAERG